jgi:hypothetical protein
VSEPAYSAGCACGQVRFKARGAPKRVGLCHCMTCRKTSGSAFNAFVVFPAAAVTVEGQVHGWQAEPGADHRCFCPTCGSQVFARGTNDEIETRLGVFDEPNLFQPAYEAWIGRKEVWLHTDDLPSYEKNRPVDD